MKLQIIKNGTFQDERVLLNLDTNEILVKGDYYHDKITEYIQGFLHGLRFAKVEYELLNNIDATPNMELFKICKFENNDFEDTDEDFEDNTETVEEEIVENEINNEFWFKICGDRTINLYCDIITALDKTRDIEADLYYISDDGEKIIYSCLGFSYEYNNELLYNFGIFINEDNEIEKLNDMII